MPLETIQPTDSAAVRKQIKELQKRGYRVIRYTEYQLKVGAISYFPSTGTIVIDPRHKHSEKGFDAFLGLLKRSQSPNIIELSRL